MVKLINKEVVKMNNDDKILHDLVNINTAGKNEAEISQYLKIIFDEHSIENTIIDFDDGRSGIIATIGNSNGPTIAFDGHADTVAIGDVERWKVGPLDGTEVDGKIFGRGITDMKSGLAAGVVTMLRLKKQESHLKGTFKLFATVGEESGELGAKQMVELGLANNIDALLVGEPSGVPVEFVETLSQGKTLPGIALSDDIHEIVKSNKTKEQHFLEIAHKGAISYVVKSEGITAHSSMPELGINAIEGLIKFANRQQNIFNELADISNQVLGTTTPVVTEISGGEQPNTVPGSAQMTVFVRTIPEVTNTQIITSIQNAIDDINAEGQAIISLNVGISLEAIYSSADTKLSQLTKRVGEKKLNQTLPFIGVSGGTDASQFVKANPDMEILIFGPGNITAHQANEFVYADMYHDFIDIYEEVIINYLK